MFDISPVEMLTIALVALIVFGPQRLPDIARRAGHYIREIRRAASDLTAGLEREVQDIQAPLKELKEDLTKPVSELRGSIDETTKSIQEPLKDAAAELSKSVSPGGPGEVPGAPEPTAAGADGEVDEGGPQSGADDPSPQPPSSDTGSSDAGSSDAGHADGSPAEHSATQDQPPATQDAADQDPDERGAADEPKVAGDASISKVRWVADEPSVGVSPDDAWKGIDDPVPPGLVHADDTPIPVSPTDPLSGGAALDPERDGPGSEAGRTHSPPDDVGDSPADADAATEQEPAE